GLLDRSMNGHDRAFSLVLWSVASRGAQKGAGAGDMAAGPRESQKGRQRAAEAALPGKRRATARTSDLFYALGQRGQGARPPQRGHAAAGRGESSFRWDMATLLRQTHSECRTVKRNVLCTRWYISENAPRQGYSVPHGKDFFSAPRPEL